MILSILLSIIFEPVTVVILLIAVAAVLYYYRYNLLTGAKVRSYQATEVISHSQLKTEANIECPSCGRTMEAGYLVGPQGIYWTKNAQLSGFFASRGMLIPGAEPMGFSSILRGPARIQNLKAYRCQRCNIVQVNLDEQQPVEF